MAGRSRLMTMWTTCALLACVLLVSRGESPTNKFSTTTVAPGFPITDMQKFVQSANTLQLGQDSLDFLQASGSSHGNVTSRNLFIMGLASYHNFWFEVAIEFFKEARATKEAYPMAAWGEALCERHLLWLDDGYNSTRANELLAMVETSMLTPFEEQMVDATKSLFDVTSSPHLQVHNFAEGLRSLYKEHGNSSDVQAFYGLAMLANITVLNKFNDESGQKEPKLSAAPAREVLAHAVQQCMETGCHHPGVLHYLIHSYDFDGVAMDQYSTYAAANLDLAAQDAPHALHMPSHLYFRHGLVAEAVAANQRSYAAQERFCDMPGVLAVLYLKRHFHCFRDSLHARNWAHYGLLQLGRVKEANTQLAIVNKQLRSNFGLIDEFGRPHDRIYLNQMNSRHVVELHDWCTTLGSHSYGPMLSCAEVDGRLQPMPNLYKKVSLPEDPEWYNRAKAWLSVGLGAAHMPGPSLLARLNLLNNASAELQWLASLLHGQEDRTKVDGFAIVLKAYGALLKNNRVPTYWIAKLLDTVPDSSFPFYPLAEARGNLLLDSSPQEAQEEFELVLQHFPNRLLALWGRAQALHAQQTDKSSCASSTRSAYQAILALDETSAFASPLHPAFKAAAHYMASNCQDSKFVPPTTTEAPRGFMPGEWKQSPITQVGFVMITMILVVLVGAVWWWFRGRKNTGPSYSPVDSDMEAFVMSPVNNVTVRPNSKAD